MNSVKNAYYNSWTCLHYCSCILAFGSDGRIIYLILNAPSSWHDSAIVTPLYQQLLDNTPSGYCILSDTAFPCKYSCLQQQIMALVKQGDWLPASPWSFSQLKVMNDQIVSAWQAAKWGMHSLQGSFSRLKLPLPANNHEFRLKLLETICRLHQLRTRTVGINQTRTVYDAVWDEHQILCRDFHDLLFSDIQKRCHISRYYNGWL